MRLRAGDLPAMLAWSAPNQSLPARYQTAPPTAPTMAPNPATDRELTFTLSDLQECGSLPKPAYSCGRFYPPRRYR